ncbi:unnamed protein product [Vitrella brassicaformis CCMP3155]|uniref:Uncharacterized protein n=1 Tax=Vitrella brassicaformis (strain CCMP3155) TaxID=1169540 RepID=A0A0G4EPG9_VITBC|nr:unnamed protein product [Vitrella brassicaformis CCMP3155]|eukprot:CEL99722.1 unnamed protein product [Vitrella brassicaformis CCMP3155]
MFLFDEKFARQMRAKEEEDRATLAWWRACSDEEKERICSNPSERPDPYEEGSQEWEQKEDERIQLHFEHTRSYRARRLDILQQERERALVPQLIGGPPSRPAAILCIMIMMVAPLGRLGVALQGSRSSRGWDRPLAATGGERGPTCSRPIDYHLDVDRLGVRVCRSAHLSNWLSRVLQTGCLDTRL